jgi:hypothetical protein
VAKKKEVIMGSLENEQREGFALYKIAHALANLIYQTKYGNQWFVLIPECDEVYKTSIRGVDVEIGLQPQNGLRYLSIHNKDITDKLDDLKDYSRRDFFQELWTVVKEQHNLSFFDACERIINARF